MSSIVTEEFVPGRKLLVHVAENGHSFELDCEEGTSVEQVQHCLESLSGISFSDQLLLCGDLKLDSQRPLLFYKLPCDDRDVFLYNRARLVPDSPLPPLEQIEIAQIPEPTSPSSSQNPHPLDDASDPALKALPSYERQFRYHFQKGHAIYGRTKVKYDACKSLFREQKVQERALETATGNMDHYYQMICQMYIEFMKYFSQQHRYHSDILQNFGKDMEKLRLCKLHPSLQSESRRCLLDFIKEENFRKWADNCASSHRQFEAKVSQLKAMFAELKRKVEDMFSSRFSVNIMEVEQAIKENQRYLNEQTSIMQSLSKDVNTVKKLVDDCLSCQLSTSLRPHDAVSALGPMYEVHDKSHLPEMQACDHSISKLLEFCRGKKSEMNLFVHNSMKKIAYVQSVIRDIRMQLPAFKEAMGRQDVIFSDLILVRRIGPAYRACLAEIVRRKASMKLYMGLAGQLAEKLARKREVEVRRREEFLKSQSVYIPQDILAAMGLFDSPSQCDVNIAPFDTNLLEIDIAEIDRYAPESFTEFSSKLEWQASAKSLHTTSNDVSHSADLEETSLDTREKFDSEEFSEGFESVEIAGTSKIEVENAWLKAELASAIALNCSFNPQIDCESLDDSKMDILLKSTAEKTAEALHLKDEYGKHLQAMLKMKQKQCLTYERRIRELEERLSNQYLQRQKGNRNDASKSNDCKSEISASGETHVSYISPEPMDEVSCTSAPLDLKLEFSEQLGKSREGVDENMADFSGMPQSNSLDATMMEPNRDDLQVGNEMEKEKPALAPKADKSMVEALNVDTIEKPDLASNAKDKHVSELQNALADKSTQCDEAEIKIKGAVEEISSLRRELEINRTLLDESQMNCAHLENCLHEAREEAQTNLCAADRRASEYNSLRSSAVKMRGLFERLRSCVSASGGVADFADSLRSLALSLNSSSLKENEDDVTVEFGACIRVLADRVGILSRPRAELLDRCSRAEATNGRLSKELEGKNELVKSLYAKHKMEKQANKDKISFGRFEVHELAAFIVNSAGHYEAINRNCSNYFLSAESVALFTDHLPTRPSYIIGQIVHIEHNTARSPGSTQAEKGDELDLLSTETDNPLASGSGSSENPYGLPVGCEYFVVTVAMLPDTLHSSPPP